MPTDNDQNESHDPFGLFAGFVIAVLLILAAIFLPSRGIEYATEQARHFQSQSSAEDGWRPGLRR